MSKILITTDFSANSKAGMRFALQLASQAPYELTFYHAIEILKPTSWNNERFKNFSASKIKEGVEKLQRFVYEVCNQSGSVPGKYNYVVEIGTDVGKRAVLCAKKIKADFICLSTRGAGKIQKLFGTHASVLITTSPIPVITVPKGYRAKPVKNLFYASDFSALPKELRAVKEFARPLKASIDVFHYDYLLHVPENRQKLENKIARLRSPEIEFFFKRQEVEYPLSHHLRNDIRKTRPSLIVLFTKQNRNWYDRLFLPSESADMAFNTKVPLLTFRKK